MSQRDLDAGGIASNRSVEPGAPGPVDVATVALTVAALAAFASNSILTRLALGTHQIDASAFTAVRLLSGAVALALIVRVKDGSWSSLRPLGAAGPVALLAYAAPFSLAYIRIGAAVGALVLFGSVQLTMVGYGIAQGDRPRPLAWFGMAVASCGLLWLTVRSASRPDPLGVLLMIVAGVFWGIYSIAGRSERDPIASNARNFVWSAPAAVVLAAAFGRPDATVRGVQLAVASGALASALGYIVWYRALPRLAVVHAAVAQLSVPLLAALGAVLVLSEPVTGRLLVSGAAVLGGIALVLASRQSAARRLR